MFVTSACKVFFPRGFDFIDMFFDQGPGLSELILLQSIILRQSNLGFNPKLGLSATAIDGHMDATFLTGKEPKSLRTEYCWTHASNAVGSTVGTLGLKRAYRSCGRPAASFYGKIGRSQLPSTVFTCSCGEWHSVYRHRRLFLQQVSRRRLSKNLSDG